MTLKEVNMEEKEIMTFADVRKIIGEHLKTALDIEDFSINFAKQEKDILDHKDVWRVTVEFVEMVGNIEWPTSAAFTIDATTGEVKQFMKGRAWRF